MTDLEETTRIEGFPNGVFAVAKTLIFMMVTKEVRASQGEDHDTIIYA